MYKVIKFLQDALWSSGYMIYTFLSPTPVLLAVASFASSLAVSMGRLLSSHFLSTHKLDRTDSAAAHSLLGLANNNSNNNQGSCYHSYRQPDSVKAVQNIICTKFSVIRDIPWSIFLWLGKVSHKSLLLSLSLFWRWQYLPDVFLLVLPKALRKARCLISIAVMWQRLFQFLVHFFLISQSVVPDFQ